MSESKPRLLIIDDQPDSVALLLSYLENSALDILVALDGRDGLNKAVSGKPELILLDISMPGMDGFAVCAKLKEDPRTERIPVIFLSGRDAIDDKLRGFAIGGVDYITKPFSEEEVLARVAVHLQTRQRLERLEGAAAMRLLENAGERAHPDERLFVRAIAQLENHLAAPPGLVDLARQLGTNQRKLTELFRRRVGMTVFDYFTELRLKTARRLLEDSALQVQLIADRIGYSNSGDFSRAFRRRFGVSPREYRQARGIATEEGA
jgi:YesN/AraC family two-component response regulator